MWRHVARSVTPGIELAKQSYGGQDPSAALLGEQLSYFDKDDGFIETQYYDGDKLVNGMIVEGPAIVVLPDTTIVVPPRFKITTQEAAYYVMEVPV